MLYQLFAAVSRVTESFFLLQCSTRGAKLFKHLRTWLLSSVVLL